MFSAIFTIENVNFDHQTQETSFAAIDNSLEYLIQIIVRTSIYTRFTSFGASHVWNKFEYGKREFRPPKRKKIRLLRLTIL
jgi:hypothetical protein